MGRATQIIAYINADKAPNSFELLNSYSHIEQTEELKKERYEYRLFLNKNKDHGKAKNL